MPNKNLPILKWALILGIIIVLNLFFYFAVRAVYPEPKFETFCPQKQVTVVPTTSESCIAQGGAWTQDPSIELKRTVPITPGDPTSITQVREGYCDVNFTCNKNFTEARNLYERNVFIALIILGVISIAIGIFALSGPVSLGLSLGGVLSFVIASIRFWSQMQEYLRVIILGLALATLIWIGLKWLKD